MSKLMNPALQELPQKEQENLIENFRKEVDPLIFSAFWFSLFRTDQRPSLEKIDVPVLYLMPEDVLYSTINTDYI